MAVFDIWSRRQKPAPEVLTYDKIPHALRIQLLHAMDDAAQLIHDRTIPGYMAIGTEGKDCFATACQRLRRELGKGKLESRVPRSPSQKGLREEFTTFFENCETEHVLDAIEIVMRLIENAQAYLDQTCNAQTVGAEINARFRQHGIGYQYEAGQVIVESNRVLHAEATLPALQLLSDPAYKGANEEFLKAHEHYRHGRYGECLNECLKAFESTMKIVCDRKGWTYGETATARKLIEICLDHKLVPIFSQQQLTSLRTLLESGVPTARNKQSGHGQGSQLVQVPDILARYALHLTAANVVLLADSAK